ncbi:MAG: hypothetical protein AAF901_11010 [Bacteroidota bacterium]
MKKLNVVGIGLIDMLTGFLVSSIVLMLVIAYNQPTAGDTAGYPRDFVKLDLMLLKQNSNDLLIRKGARLNFILSTPEGKEFSNQIVNAKSARNEYGYLRLLDKNLKATSDYYLWGPSFKKTDNRVSKDTLIYTLYGVTAAEDKSNWQLAIRYYDNELLSAINFGNESSIAIPMEKVINQPLKVWVRWRFIDGKNYDGGDPKKIYLGMNEVFKVKPRL